MNISFPSPRIHSWAQIVFNATLMDLSIFIQQLINVDMARNKTVKTVWFYSYSVEPRLKPWLITDGSDGMIACQPLAGVGSEKLN